jgi:NADH-quinone oxidoreductase subunit N
MIRILQMQGGTVTRNETLFLLPVGLLLLGVLVCLVLEAAGTPVGARKRGERVHLAMFTLFASATALVQLQVFRNVVPLEEVIFNVILHDHLGYLGGGIALVLLIFTVFLAIPSLRVLQKDIGEIYVLLLLATISNIILVCAVDLILIGTALVLSFVSCISLCVLSQERSSGAEAAIKITLVSAAILSVVGFAAALLYSSQLSTNFAAIAAELQTHSALGTLVFFLLALAVAQITPFAPLHGVRVDVLQGSPFFVSSFVASGFFLCGSVFCLRLFSGLDTLWLEELRFPMLCIISIGLFVPAIAASDQSEVRRMVAFLIIGQGGCLLTTIHLHSLGHASLELCFFVIAATILSTLGPYSVLSCIESREKEPSTLEEWSGLGKQHPLFALAVLWMTGSTVGIPGTVGFAVRMLLAKSAFAASEQALGVILIVSLIISAVPLFRFGILLFAKTPFRPNYFLDKSVWRNLAIVISGVAILLFGLFFRPTLVFLSYWAGGSGPAA